ncbi:hypothetical protein COCSADRAFT_37598 [Bipolaris sorokiniana ND90Pr]|uniref:Uncharacterized protein n=1 Tax=Cochliobolus sativus (strain ND90Pr / ATCC 201652) TaxID=665912 RepID=M2S922_COCSN|nr:uncharacterized protein COCSADRAFT_37598 [Bipolaris sorokiniana ND90Pr]EMD63848.1 hypothetical protein COCSADRAFT_37598 [Bipolaris sorokiniana ND90Pr]
MRSYVAVSIFAFSASVLSAPTPQLGLNNVVGSVTGTATGTVGSLTGTVGKTVDPVTGVVSDDVNLEGVTGLLKEKRQLEVVNGLTRPVTDLTKPVTDIVGDATKIRVLGNARRQLNIAPVAGLTKTVDGVTNSVNLSGAVKGVNTDINSKRQLNVAPVAGLTKTVDGVTNSINLSGAVKGVNTDVNSKRQLNIAPVAGLTETVDRVTDSINLSGAVKGVNADVNSKRQLNIAPVAGLTKTVDGVTNSINLSGAVKGVNADVNSKRQLLNLDTTTESVDSLTGLNSNELTADVTHGQVVDTGNLLNLDLNVKRGVPVVQDLPLGGGVSGILDNTPVVGGLTNTVNSLTGDLDPVTGLVYETAKPVTDATEVLDVRAPLLEEVEVKSTVGDVNVPALKDLPVVNDI